MSLVAIGLLQACVSEPDEATRMERAKAYEQKGAYRAAIIELKNVLQKNPQQAQARRWLGELSLKVGQYAQSEKELRVAQRLGVPRSDVLVLLGDALVKQGKYQDAIKAVEPESLEDGEQRAKAIALLGDAYMGIGEAEKARARYRQAHGLSEKNVRALVGLARIDALKGDMTQAKERLARALSMDPGDINALILQGRLQLREGDYASAEAAFNQVIGRLQGETGLTNEALDAWIGSIQAQMAQGETEEALAEVDELLSRVPGHPVALYLKARLAYDSGDYPTAEQYLAKILKYDDRYHPAISLLGMVKYAEGNLEQANMYLSRFVALEPGDIPAGKLLAQVRLQLNQPTEAIEALVPRISETDKDPDILTLLGLAHVLSGDADKGIEYLESAVAQGPETGALRLKLAQAYLINKQPEKALQLLKGVNAHGADPHQITRLKVIALLEQGERGRALELAREHSKTDDRGVESQRLLAGVYLALGDADQAREALEAARGLAPDDPKTLLGLGALNAKAGAYDRARQDYLRVLKVDQDNVQALIGLGGVARGQGRHKQAVEWLQRAAKVAPRAVRPRLLLAMQYLDRREFRRARGVALEAERIAPNRADVLAVLGVSQLLDKDYTNAIGSLKKAIGLAPRSVPLRYYLARAHLARREVDEARAVLREAMEMAPDYSPVITTLAYLEAQAGKFDQALALAQGEQAQANPQSIEVQGDIRLMQGRYKQAAALYAKAGGGPNSARLAVKAYLARRKGGLAEPFRPLVDWVQGHPDDTRMRLILAQAYQEANQAEMAIEQYEALLKRSPDNVRVLNNLAWIYHLQGDDRSIRLAEKAHRLSPGTGAVSDTLGWLLVGRGDLRRAVELLRLAATQSPEVPEIQYHLAVALARSGEGREAQRILTRLISAGGRSPLRDQAQQLLKELNSKDLGLWQGVEWPYRVSFGLRTGLWVTGDIDLRVRAIQPRRTRRARRNAVWRNMEKS